MPDLSGQRAVVTGASSGIGLEMATLLASWGCRLVLVARRRKRLDALAESLQAAHQVEVEVVAADLSVPGAAAALVADVYENGSVDILINNAGYGDFCRVLDREWADTQRMIQLNIVTLSELTILVARRMVEAGRPAHVLNVGSVVGFFPPPFFATYAGTKAYVANFSLALAAELKRTNVSVTCLSPGPVATEFADVASMEAPGIASALMMSPARCARAGLRAMLRGKRHCVPGVFNKLTLLFNRLVPRRTVGAIMVAPLPEPAPASTGSARTPDQAQP